MNRMTSISRFSMALSVMLYSIGCDLEPGTLESLREAVTTISTQQTVVIHEDEKTDIAEGTFVAPNPDRVDPFSFPVSAPKADGQSTSINTVAQVEILGFANVYEPRVFLRIKAMTESLGVGGITDGVEVVAIRPPAVDLRRGSLLWTHDVRQELAANTSRNSSHLAPAVVGAKAVVTARRR